MLKIFSFMTSKHFALNSYILLNHWMWWWKFLAISQNVELSYLIWTTWASWKTRVNISPAIATHFIVKLLTISFDWQLYVRIFNCMKALSHCFLTKKRTNARNNNIHYLIFTTSPFSIWFIYYDLYDNVRRKGWNSLNEVDFTLLCIGHFPVIRQWVWFLILFGFSWFCIIHLLL